VKLPPATVRLAAAARELGLELDVHLFPAGTKTAADAAAAIGCPVAAIVKSLVFVLDHPGEPSEPVVVLMAGDRRLDTTRLAELADATASRRATLDEVREATGFAAGGTPPFGHVTPVRVFADVGLRRHDPVWAAGGTPTTVFPISLTDLERTSRPRWGELAVAVEEPPHPGPGPGGW
jgi:prolyl-tRNA editing enzyme YbaK/EbsC (Cys-tRNA(Pro) deacylase)